VIFARSRASRGRHRSFARRLQRVRPSFESEGRHEKVCQTTCFEKIWIGAKKLYDWPSIESMTQLGDPWLQEDGRS
jgi:hypothetical protein